MTTTWLVCQQPNEGARMRMFCFPHSGGGVPVFRGWGEALPDVEVWAVQFPGRGSHFRGQPLERMEPLLEKLQEEMGPYLDERPFTFFGHSLGALVAFELARARRRAERSLPEMLFLSACDAPHLLPVRPPVRHLPEPEFLREVQSMGGTPPEILAHKELVSLLLPALRADFAVYETYEYREERPLDIPIIALGGEADEVVSMENVLAWEKHAGERFSSRFFPGGHFYLQEKARALLDFLRWGLTTPIDRANTDSQDRINVHHQ